MKDYFLIIDTETTQSQLVADFGATISDRKGNVVAQTGVLMDGIYNNASEHPLFFTSDSEGIWSRAGQDRRYGAYELMINDGSRMIASVAAVNRWLVKALVTYNPILTAYNLPFDLDKCNLTGINVTIFERKFCLWAAAYTQFAHTKAYRNFALQCHAFNPPTNFGNMTYQTNAEIMTRFVTGNPSLKDEPHSALEDILEYEILVLNKILKTRSTKWLLTKPISYNWRNCQVRDNFESL